MSDTETKDKSNATPIYLVTGAGGFTGAYVVRQLLSTGTRVRAMVRDPAQAAALKALGAEVVMADITQPETLPAAVEGVEGVYHIAALFRKAGLPDEVYEQVNIEGVRHLLDASIEAGVKRFIHCSTVGVMGHIDEPPATEQTPYSPGDIYQRTKMEGEKLALSYFREGKIPGVVIRPGMIFGPGDDRTLKLFRMIARKKFFYVGPGRALVHWVDVRDLAKSFELAMQHSERNGEIYIIAGKQQLPLVEMVAKVAKQLGVKPPWLHLPVKPMQWAGSLCEAICTPLKINPPLYRRRVDFFTKDRHFNVSKARDELGFEPAQELDAEIADIIAAYREQGLI